MWDNKRPLKLLANLDMDCSSIQYIIDLDKYLASEELGYDLCGKYMPCCAFCNKQAPNPCAAAYYASKHFTKVCPMIDACETENLFLIQRIIDVDKYLASEKLGCDLCGKYAPFCTICDKNAQNPCAEAYLSLKAVNSFGISALATQSGGQLQTIDCYSWDYSSCENDGKVCEDETDGKADEDGANVKMVTAFAGEPALTAEAPRRGIKIGTARRRLPRG